jgi:PAS domain S-box-containing protein
MKEKPLPKQLLSLRKKTAWSWERMCREFHRVMAEEGPSHTTLFRYASGRVRRRNVLTERYVKEAIDRVTVELARNKLSESETQQKEEFRFSKLVEHTQDLIFRYGRDPLGCEYINPAVKDMLGYTPEEFYADPQLAFKIVHPDDRASLEVDFQDTSTLRATRRWIHKNGNVIRCEEVCVPIYDEDGNLVAVEGISREVPDRK